jgi:hypothetical protein
MKDTKTKDGGVSLTSVQQPEPPKNPAVKTNGRYHKGGSTARRMLAQLKFDPIVQMVNSYLEICQEIDEMNELKKLSKIDENGNVRRYSSMAHGQLLALKQKLVADLLRYGYARVPETVNLNGERPAAFVLNLHTDPETFKLANEQSIEDAKVIDNEVDE